MICQAAHFTIHQASSVFQRAQRFFSTAINAGHKLLYIEDNLLDRAGANPNGGGDAAFAAAAERQKIVPTEVPFLVKSRATARHFAIPARLSPVSRTVECGRG